MSWSHIEYGAADACREGGFWNPQPVALLNMIQILSVKNGGDGRLFVNDLDLSLTSHAVNAAIQAVQNWKLKIEVNGYPGNICKQGFIPPNTDSARLSMPDVRIMDLFWRSPEVLFRLSAFSRTGLELVYRWDPIPAKWLPMDEDSKFEISPTVHYDNVVSRFIRLRGTRPEWPAK